MEPQVEEVMVPVPEQAEAPACGGTAAGGAVLEADPDGWVPGRGWASGRGLTDA